MSILITESLEAGEAYNLTAIHAALKLGSHKHPALFEQDTEFHYFNRCGQLTATFEPDLGMTHWGNPECLDAYSRWLGYEDLSQMLDNLPTE